MTGFNRFQFTTAFPPIRCQYLGAKFTSVGEPSKFFKETYEECRNTTKESMAYDKNICALRQKYMCVYMCEKA